MVDPVLCALISCFVAHRVQAMPDDNGRPSSGTPGGRLPALVFLHPSDEMYGADRQLVALVTSVRDLVHPIVVIADDLPYSGALSKALRAEGIETVAGPLPVLRRRYAHPRRLAP